MTNGEQQLLLHLLFRTRERFSRTTGASRPMVRCKICTNDWPETSRADYHTADCPVPACERLLLNDGVDEYEVYYPMQRAPAERGRELQPSEQNRVVSGTEFVKSFPKGTPIADIFNVVEQLDKLPTIEPPKDEDGKPKLSS